MAAEPRSSAPSAAALAPASTSAVLSATNLRLRYGVHTILADATLAVNEHERIGLVGRNGTGKSTFLRIAAGELEPDGGQVVRRRQLISSYLPQSFQLDDAATVGENVLAGGQAILDLIHEYEHLAPESPRAGELLDRINHLDGWNLDQRAAGLRDHLGCPPADRVAGTLSGGEKRRVALCRALLAQPDLLVLDEPTNHLDVESIEWLEDYLRRFAGTCLFVTHDRYFLDRITTRIVELANGTFFSYQGNYTDYLLAKAERQALEENQERRRQKFLRRELDWVRRQPKARTTKSRDRLDRYQEAADAAGPEEELDVELIIPPAPKLTGRIIELDGVGVDLGGRTLCDQLSFELTPGQRLGIVGRNGLGKTTLLRVMLGELPPTRGEVKTGPRTLVNYVDQGRLQLDEEKTVYEEVGGGSDHVALGEESITVRSYLRRFLFTDERVNTRVAQLSGGERSRVVLAKILRRGGNVIVLDEPTNDLDLATLRVLEEALLGFGGCVVAVSHDRYFLNRVCTSILAFEGDGRVFADVGNYDRYLEKRAVRRRAEETALASWEAAAAARRPGGGGAGGGATAGAHSAARGKARKLSLKETQELGGIEARITDAEQEVSRLEAELSEPEFFREQAARWKEHETRLETARAQVARLYARWEELEKVRAAGGPA